MSNAYYTFFNISLKRNLNEEKLNEILKKFLNEEKILDLKKIIPLPKVFNNTWLKENWGTKWNIVNSIFKINNKKDLEIYIVSETSLNHNNVILPILNELKNNSIFFYDVKGSSNDIHESFKHEFKLESNKLVPYY